MTSNFDAHSLDFNHGRGSSYWGILNWCYAIQELYRMTDQIREILVYEGWETSLANCPHIPFNDERIKQLDYDEIEDPDGLIFSTACWREYVGTWEIKDGRFYLNNIIGKYKIIDGLPIFADWFSGKVTVPRGDLLDCNIELGFKLTYEQELHLIIEQGSVTQSRLVDNRK